MTIASFNKREKEAAVKLLFTCCGSQKWVDLLMKSFPLNNEEELIKTAQNIWYDQCKAEDWLEAFTHHPKIGDVKCLAEKFSATQHLAGNEQASVKKASNTIIEDLARANSAYELKFGFIFIVCATGNPLMK